MRILKLQTVANAKAKTICYKKIDPFADTETHLGVNVGVVAGGYKKIDPFADTETLNLAMHTRRSFSLQKNRSVCGY